MESTRQKFWYAIAAFGAAMMGGSVFKFIEAYQKLQIALAKGEPTDNPYVWLVCFGFGVCFLFLGYSVAAMITRVRCWGCDAYVPRDSCSETDNNSWMCPVCLKNSDKYPFGSKNLPPTGYCNNSLCHRKVYKQQLVLPHYKGSEGRSIQLKLTGEVELKRFQQITNSMLICPRCLHTYQVMNIDPSQKDKVAEAE